MRFNILQQVGLEVLAPHLNGLSFEDWWAGASSRVSGQIQKGLNAIIILDAWSLWKHRNHCVFYERTPSLIRVVSDFKEAAQNGL